MTTAAEHEAGKAPAGDPSARRGGHRQRRDDVPVFRDQPSVLLHLETPLRRTGAEGLGTGRAAEVEPERHPCRHRRQDLVPATELPLRAGQDLDVPPALPRRRHLELGRMADPQTLGAEPATCLAALQETDKRWKRYEKQLPGHQVQIDVKFIAPLKGAPPASTTSSPRSTTAPGYESCASTLGSTKRPPSSSSTTSCSAALPGPDHPDRQRRRIRIRVPLPRARQRHRPRYIKPRTPRLNGKVERSHRIDAEEFYRLLDGVVIDDAKVFNDKLQEWEDFYNFHRPHGGLGGQTPYERLRQKNQTRE